MYLDIVYRSAALDRSSAGAGPSGVTGCGKVYDRGGENVSHGQ